MQGLGPFDLTGRSVLVVGASSGIGAASARLLCRLGARTILLSRKLEGLEKVRLSLAVPSSATLVAADYLDSESMEQALRQTGEIDHIIISAVADENKKRGGVADLSHEMMRSSFDKFWGQVNTVRAALPYLAERGSVVLFSSIAGISPTQPKSGLSIMNGVQAAVIQTGKSLAVELAPRRVNILAPGIVLTNVWSEEKRAELAGWMETNLPTRHAGQPEDVALAAIGLILNPYITGVVLPVDGGLLLQ